MKMNVSIKSYFVRFAVSADTKNETFVISIRGTLSAPDTVTDLYALNINLPEVSEDCYCHKGISLAARRVLTLLEENDLFQNALHKHPDWRVLACGHSLGKLCIRQ